MVKQKPTIIYENTVVGVFVRSIDVYKRQGFYARGVVPRRSADRKADHVLRPIF